MGDDLVSPVTQAKGTISLLAARNIDMSSKAKSPQGSSYVLPQAQVASFSIFAWYAAFTPYQRSSCCLMGANDGGQCFSAQREPKAPNRNEDWIKSVDALYP